MKRFLALLMLVLSSGVQAVSITVWTKYERSDLDWLRQQADDFQRRTGHSVAISVQLPFDMAEQFIQQASTGKGPDLVVGMTHDYVGKLAATGVVEPLERWIKTLTLPKEPTQDAFSLNGRVFGLPLMAESVAVIYNKKLLPKAPMSWAAFLNAARADTRAGRLGYLTDLGNTYMQYGVIRAFGGYVFGQLNGTWDVQNLGIANAGAVRAAQFLNDLRFRYAVVPEGLDSDQARQAFIDGRAAMILTGPWDIGAIASTGINYGIVNFPQPPGAPNRWSPMVGVDGIVVSAYSRQKAVAVQFARRLAAPEQQITLYRASGRLPASATARAMLKADPVVSGFGAAITAGAPFLNIRAMEQVWGDWAGAIRQVVTRRNPPISRLLSQAAQQIITNLSKK